MNGDALDRLIEQARRRFVFNLILDQAALAIAIALGAIALLLLAGTQILNWAWPVIIFSAAVVFGLWRVRSRAPDAYTVAQRLDHQARLHDSLSTAWHFRNTSIDVFSEEVKRAQHADAERQAAALDAALTVPYRFPKSLRFCLPGLIAVIALFGLRYGVQRSLDLRQPLVTFDSNVIGESGIEQVAKRGKAPKGPEEHTQSISVEPAEHQPEQGLDPAPDSALGVVDVPDVNNENAETSSRSTDEKGPGAGDASEKGETAGEGEGESSDKTPGNEGDKSAIGDGKNAQSAQNQQPAQQGENSSLMNKMRDALANMMAKMNQQNRQSGEQSQQSQDAKQSQASGNSRQPQSKQGMQAKGQQAGEQQSAADQQGQDMQESDPSQSSQGKPGERNSQQASSQQNQSGMGKQDGDKDTKLAEQLDAMGKISEIIGKRNANLQGEIMVEVNSSRQSLRTQYTDRNASHTDAGGEIYRDEVPLMFQNYVQQYFDEVRKQPEAPRTRAVKPSTSRPSATAAEAP